MTVSSRSLGRRAGVGLGLAILFVATFLLSLLSGRYSASLADVLGSLVIGAENLMVGAVRAAGLAAADPAMTVDPAAFQLVIFSRLPRALAAALVGASLAAAGAAYQGVFRNPLVNPGLLGVSNGAGFGAALAIVVLGGGAAVYPSAFLFGVAAVALSYWIARVYRQAPTIMLLLGGTVVSSVFAALVSLLKYLADADTQLPEIVFWLMGSLASVGWDNLWAALPMGAGMAVLLLYAWRIDVLSMGDKEARSLGIDVSRDKAIVIGGATLATAGAVCLSGVIGWVGLIIPHIGRMIVGSDGRRLLPVSMVLGASFLMVVDTLARTLTPNEIPLGILTALVGAPFFVYLLKRTKGAGWR